MDNILKHEMDNIKREVGEVSSKVDDVSTDVREMKDALMGNRLAKDGGLVGRIIELEGEVAELKAWKENHEKEKSKTDLQVKIMWGLGGTTAAGVIGYILHLIFK